MSERMYRLLLALYPAPFRDEYGTPALDLLRDRLRAERGLAPLLRLWLDLIADAAVSIPVEYHREPLRVADPHPHSERGLAFHECGSEIPSRVALVNGAMVSIAVFTGLVLFMGSEAKRTPWLLGSHHPSPSHILPAHATTIPKTELDAEVKLKTAPFEPPISPYFKLILVLGALDADRDNVISGIEIDNAAAALRRLDKNHDGKLSAEECGAVFPRTEDASDPQFVKRFLKAFMRVHPVLAVLDADHDGEISASEIRSAHTSLRFLDLNGDGKLVEGELRPDRAASAVTGLIVSLDANGDNKVSREEFSSSPRWLIPPRIEFDRADSNHDGFLTREELTRALQPVRRPKPATTK